MSTHKPLEVFVSRHGSWRVAVLRGDLDMATARHLEEQCAGENDHLALDMSDVRFIDSSGLRSLVQLNNDAAGLVLLSPSAVVRRLLSLTEMSDLFDIADELPDLDS